MVAAKLRHRIPPKPEKSRNCVAGASPCSTDTTTGEKLSLPALRVLEGYCHHNDERDKDEEQRPIKDRVHKVRPRLPLT